ncbi:methylenetetrahydrofolate--tRNA-(uracil(54)-C(5))-methyltransferase (FADH(2)-oxidizing) TrmFO [Devosia ginsengisoli]|uniref:Methylenetetrahydrofolate--tRNA-(uracil-5-)-methyltransferase TrmFO n=1 Tax=Devosia ginsengisoli TaxID=400770 RepID=A0A5B8LP05_9HYPH|nr:methylenetetrahydrofolate--tRNA-(uracil(54)-C(5))-methyltransferase (FADH(2)-oxidizing) TrmFO [Devosia ginsengisoli]QDZ10077.1 methylenetetrahydrofolate--tRNA-(uracil(54)-C(5))-methyltransferase (FADH(2)-oxidizing) TrmFO [Devosia ginsengisoli]
MSSQELIHIIGGGLAGSEAAWQAAEAGATVIVHEMRGVKETDAHSTDSFAELVCSNSFRSDDHEQNAVGLLHEEMRRCNSLIMRAADLHKLPAGGALAVDRHGFSAEVTRAIHNHPNITVVREEVAGWPPDDWSNVIIASGPLTSPALADAILAKTGEDALAFFDAIAPIVHKDSINMDVVWAQSRYDKAGPGGTGADYLNCPMDKDQYFAFVEALKTAPLHEFKDWEKVPYFDGCLPIEVMAERGVETLRHGPMKPVGLTNPRSPTVKCYAIVQLRQDNALGTLWNMVGFQTKMRYGIQAEIFRMIPGLENAQFARLGGLHRNTFINSPKVLRDDLKLKNDTRIRFAGQVTGVEGYVESAAVGLITGRLAAAEARGETLTTPPRTTALGALVDHITGGHIESESYSGARSFQPMNVNFGLFPEVSITRPEGVARWRGPDKTIAKRRAITSRALEDLKSWA